MDRFEVPGKSSVIDLTPNAAGDDGEEAGHVGLVWDRGPAGDFVYGGLNKLSPEEKKKRYEEFIAFDRQCRKDDVLFLKLLFVTNRDSIAQTLGKRLAQKNMAKDLTTWLQACSSRTSEGDVSFEGLEEITAHIDPTDFIAFNNYERNLQIFSNFALNTDTNENPWVVVNTGDRYAARKALMRAFRSHLQHFESCPAPKHLPPPHPPGIEIEDMMKAKFTRSWRHNLFARAALLGLLLLAYIYADFTKWDSPWFQAPTKFNITALLEEGVDDDAVSIKRGKAKKKKKLAQNVGGDESVGDEGTVETIEISEEEFLPNENIKTGE